jgi:hypothetical protein
MQLSFSALVKIEILVEPLIGVQYFSMWLVGFVVGLEIYDSLLLQPEENRLQIKKEKKKKITNLNILVHNPDSYHR